MANHRDVAIATDSNGTIGDRPRRPTFARLFPGVNSRPNETSTFAGPQYCYSDTSEEENIGSGPQGGLKSKAEEVRLERYYAPIDTYEGRHRYDPTATWTEAEERALIRKTDLRVCAYCCLMFFALQLDRGNISQALSDNMLKDLGMNTDDYNTGQTIFYVSFLSAELPSQLVSKKIGPDNCIIEGGFIPDVILYLSYFYKSKELPIRLSFFWTAYGGTYIISAFLAYGILHLRGHESLHGWQWLFALEGGLTAFIGVISWYGSSDMSNGPGELKIIRKGSIFHRHLIKRQAIFEERMAGSPREKKQAVTPRLLWQALKDYDMWPIYLLGFTWTIPHQCAQAYLTLILRSLKFDTFETNLLTVPAYVMFCCQLIFWTWISERFNNRYLIILFCQIWILPLVIGLETLPAGQAYAWSRYVLNIMLVGFPYVHAIIGQSG
ncbi:MAG: hypothetical protein Q9219_002479 [cf. Caloplaca sp. 3 TL-2023]